ncbi:MAG: serine/threonine-protein phosphatase [Ignavibacteriales bacterium]|nr:serine/threonine-protein phosphatase [Ignavibacteriales bacterium]
MTKKLNTKQGPELIADGFKLASVVAGVSTLVSLAVNPANFYPFWGEKSMTFFFFVITCLFLFNFTLLKLKAKRKIYTKKAAYDIWGQMNDRELLRLAIAVFFMFSIVGPITIFMGQSYQDIRVLQVLVSTFFSGLLSASIILFGKRKYLLVIFLLMSTLSIKNAAQIEQFIGGYKVHHNSELPEKVVLTNARLEELEATRVNLGIFTIGLLVTGYVLFVFVIGIEGKKRVRLETEMHVAAVMQNIVNMPDSYSKGGILIETRIKPAADVAGDYVDCFEISDSQFLMVIGDASGHGIGAGILAAMAKSAIKTAIQFKSTVPEILATVNASLFQIAGREKFMTMSMVAIDTTRKKLEIATAGHPPAFFFSSGVLQTIRTPALGLGLKRVAAYQSEVFDYKTGDSIILYTDGIIEATNKEGAEYGSQRLTECVYKNIGQNGQLCDAVVSDITQFTGNKPLEDDVSIIHLRL